MNEVWAIVLAAGESRRMGQPKMLLPFDSKTIIETVIAAILESQIENILVVVGANQEAVSDTIREMPVQIVFNPDFSTGMLSSVQVGFKSLPQDASAALVLLGDQPSISAGVIDRVCEAFFASKRSIAVPVFHGKRGHPVAIDVKYGDEIQTLLPDVGLRQVLRAHPEEILEVPIDYEGILEDIDNEQDYKRAVESRKKRLDQ